VSVKVAESVRAGQILPLEIDWMPLQSPSADYTIFLQLLAADGSLAAQHDGPPNGGYTPTTTWPPGEKILDRHGLALSPDLPAGNYQLTTGLYNPATGDRLLADRGGDFVELGSISVVSPEQ
jgi:hypothetical protein